MQKRNFEKGSIEEQIIDTLKKEPEWTIKEVAQHLGTSWQKVTKVKIKYLNEGLGDDIQDLTELTGIKKIFSNGKDCGCEKRKSILNNLPRFRRKFADIKCLEEQDYLFLKDFFANYDWIYSPKRPVLERLALIRSKTFNVRYHVSACATCIKNDLTDLQQLIKVYEGENSKN